MDDPDLNIMRDLKKHQRKYASDFEWFKREKGVKEKGIVRTLLESLSRVSVCEYRNLRHCKADPPDCLADTLDGGLVGFEVRELVDQEAIELNERGNEVYREWTDSEVIGKLSAILEEKDCKNYAGGPYRKLILVVHTAEPDLEYQHLATLLRSHLFGQTKQLTEAYLLFPRDSPNQAYPYIQLNSQVAFYNGRVRVTCPQPMSVPLNGDCDFHSDPIAVRRSAPTFRTGSLLRS